jgi:hypothetical protein
MEKSKKNSVILTNPVYSSRNPGKGPSPGATHRTSGTGAHTRQSRHSLYLYCLLRHFQLARFNNGKRILKIPQHITAGTLTRVCCDAAKRIDACIRDDGGHLQRALWTLIYVLHPAYTGREVGQGFLIPRPPSCSVYRTRGQDTHKLLWDSD